MKEREIITSIQQLVGGENPDLLQGIGDDCAVIKKDDNTAWLLTMDTLLQGVHFDVQRHPAEQLAEKALSVNVSDIAAMGGRPLFVLLSLGLPRRFDPTWFTKFSTSFAGTLTAYGCLLIGGDTVASPGGISLTLTVVGEARITEILYRSTACIGDTVWVSGLLGLSGAGLELLQLGKSAAALQPLLDAHLSPRARTALGRQLGRSGLVHAMMDVSDGLATDLAHLVTASGVGARIFADRLPVHPALAEAAEILAREPLDWILRGGEDYELLFTAAAENSDQLVRLARQCGHEITPIGTIVRGEGVTLIGDPAAGKGLQETVVSFQGFDHFGGAGNAEM